MLPLAILAQTGKHPVSVKVARNRAALSWMLYPAASGMPAMRALQSAN
jgi:hypothetical protein